MPKIPNKSISFIVSIIVSTVMSNILMEQIILCSSNAAFGIQDQIFGFDISYYMFQKPLIQTLLWYFIGVIAGLTIYIT